MSVTRVLRAQLPVLVLAALCLTACGSDEPAAKDEVVNDDASTSTGAPLPPGTPDCATIWQDGETIPRAYAGCADGDQQYVKRDALPCSSGQRIVVFNNQFYGVAGGTVHEAKSPLDQDREYRAAVLRCRA
ncbi:MAG: fimbrillin family protein [Nocardioides sp.]